MRRITDVFSSFLPLWVVLCGILGFLNPSWLVWLRPYIDWLFVFTMLGIGALLDYHEFLPVFKKPQHVILGTLAQFTIMPILGFLVAKILRLDTELALGLIIAGSVPGAMASNVISYLAKADVAYSISLTTTSTFLSPILTPFFVYILARSIIRVDFWAMFLSIIKMVILPLVIGGLLRRFLKEKVNCVLHFFPAFSTLFIALICGLVVALNQDYLKNVNLLVFLAVFIHNFLGLFLGYIAAVLYSFSYQRRRTLAIEVGMQNAGLGAVLSLKHFSSQVALPSALFATWCVITASLLARIWSKETLPNNRH